MPSTAEEQHLPPRGQRQLRKTPGEYFADQSLGFISHGQPMAARSIRRPPGSNE
jgi:hypothetical protein